MLIRLGYDIRFWLNASASMITMLNVHPSRENDLVEPDRLTCNPKSRRRSFATCLGIADAGLSIPPGELHLRNSTLIRDSGEPDQQDFHAREVPVESGEPLRL